MQIKCGCKVNLYLNIISKREDGYHKLDTLFYPLPVPFDVLEIKEIQTKEKQADAIQADAIQTDAIQTNAVRIEKKRVAEMQVEKNAFSTLPTLSHANPLKNIHILCETKGIDLEDNTLTKAYKLYEQATAFSPKLHITLKKGIPHGAGLGGGSSDAAALLTYLQEKNPSPLSQEQLIALAAKIGADVPFFLINTPCKAKGIGEVLEPVTFKLDKLYLVLVTPYLKINTKWAFSKLDQGKKDLTIFKPFGKNHRSYFLKDFFWKNDFETPVFLEYPHLGEIKNELIKQGASLALLSGSGSSIFGLFRSLETARNTVKILEETLHGDNSAKVYAPIEVQ